LVALTYTWLFLHPCFLVVMTTLGILPKQFLLCMHIYSFTGYNFPYGHKFVTFIMTLISQDEELRVSSVPRERTDLLRLPNG